MKQEINLYLPEFRPQHEWLTASRLLQASVALVAILALLSAYDFWRLSSLEQELAGLRGTLDSETRRAERLEASVSDGASEQLVQEVESREQRLARGRELLTFLQELSLGNINGFSEHLKDLARASFDGLWLEEIRLQNGGGSVYLQGMAEQTAMVPDYVGRLGNGRSDLSTRYFTRLLGARQEVDDAGETGEGRPGFYEFELETQR